MFGNDVYLLQPAVKPNEENSYSLEHNTGEALQNGSTSQYMDARGEGEFTEYRGEGILGGNGGGANRGNLCAPGQRVEENNGGEEIKTINTSE